MEDTIIVLSVGKTYQFKTEDGKDLSGCTMHYLMADTIDIPRETDGVLGVVPSKESMPISFYERAKEIGLPAKAKVRFGMKNSGGKTVLYIQGLDFLNHEIPVGKK